MLERAQGEAIKQSRSSDEQIVYALCAIHDGTHPCSSGAQFCSQSPSAFSLYGCSAPPKLVLTKPNIQTRANDLPKNEFRKEFKPSKRVAIGDAIEQELGDRRHATLKQNSEPIVENFHNGLAAKSPVTQRPRKTAVKKSVNTLDNRKTLVSTRLVSTQVSSLGRVLVWKTDITKQVSKDAGSSAGTHAIGLI